MPGTGSINMHAALILRQKVAKSTAGHLFLHTLPTQHLFVIARLLKSTARHLFLSTLATRHLFCSKKTSHMCIIATAGLKRFCGLIAPGCQACRHDVYYNCQQWSKFHFFSPKNVGFLNSKLGQVTDTNQTIACGLNS